ncbi:MAG: hypothetical protein QXV10_06790 [Nitrososphaerota archaeon]
MVVCPSCGINTSFCPNCGHSLTKDSIICDSCKKVINYCFNCNAPLRKVFEETKIKEIEASILEKPPKISLKVCFFHPKIEAIAKCDACDKLLCKDCAKKFGDLTLCPEDYPKDIEAVEYAPPTIKKYPKNSLTLISSSIILFFLQIFFIEYQSLFLEKTLLMSISYMIFVLLMIIALMIASIILIIKSKHPALGSFIIMFSSLIGLFIGGGFFIGSILGVAGGLISLVES